VCFSAKTARADVTPPPRLTPVIQASPGVHLTISGGKIGAGASLDILGGLIWNAGRDFSISPGIVAGPFAEINVVLHQGVTRTVGVRAGTGGLAPTLWGGFMPFGMATFDYGKSFGASTGKRTGVHIRSIIGGAGISRLEDELSVFTLGLELPILPTPAVE